MALKKISAKKNPSEYFRHVNFGYQQTKTTCIGEWTSGYLDAMVILCNFMLLRN
jgi:hypothetical protein